MIQIKIDIIIIGAGASGLMCAGIAGGRGKSVAVIDHNRRAAEKVLASGGGHSNFTNLHVAPERYISANEHFVKSALAKFSPKDLLYIIEKHKIEYFEKGRGEIFCKGSSVQIVQMLIDECKKSRVQIVTGCKVLSIRREDAFIVKTSNGTYRAKGLVIATGGLSYPKLGASNFAHRVAKQFGLKVTECRPALVPLLFSAKDKRIFCRLAGISFEAAVSSGQHKYCGGIIFTHNGLSGPAVLQASLHWREDTDIIINLFPDKDIFSVLLKKKRAGAKLTLKNFLAGHFPERLAIALCEEYFGSKPIGTYSEKEIIKISEGLTAWKISPAGTEGYAKAEVTLGGVDTNEISSKTMESRKVPGLYFIGEALDVTGELGGYNLHWAFASGFAAGQII